MNWKWFHVISQIIAASGTIELVDKLPLHDPTKHTVFAIISFLQTVLGIIALNMDPNKGGGIKPPMVAAGILALWFGFMRGAVGYLAVYDRDTVAVDPTSMIATMQPPVTKTITIWQVCRDLEGSRSEAFRCDPPVEVQH